MKFTDTFSSSCSVLSANSSSDLVHEFTHLSAFHESLLLNGTDEYPQGYISINTSVKLKSPDPCTIHVQSEWERTIHLTSTALARHKGESNRNSSGSDC